MEDDWDEVGISTWNELLPTSITEETGITYKFNYKSARQYSSQTKPPKERSNDDAPLSDGEDENEYPEWSEKYRRRCNDYKKYTSCHKRHGAKERIAKIMAKNHAGNRSR